MTKKVSKTAKATKAKAKPASTAKATKATGAAKTTKAKAARASAAKATKAKATGATKTAKAKPAKATKAKAPGTAKTAKAKATKTKAASASAAKATKAKAPVATKTAKATKAKAPVAAKTTKAKPASASAAKAPSAKTAKSARAGASAKDNRAQFRVKDHVVYPAHGVGRITGVETSEVAGLQMKFFIVSYKQEKMTVRVPADRAEEYGMRGIATKEQMDKALAILKGRARIKRAMWSRRAQEYDQKINSGDLVAVAEVVRDLHRAEDDPREQSYSERQLYEAARLRLCRELAAVRGSDETKAEKEIDQMFANRTTRKRRAA